LEVVDLQVQVEMIHLLLLIVLHTHQKAVELEETYQVQQDLMEVLVVVEQVEVLLQTEVLVIHLLLALPKEIMELLV
tara:strand:- start:381 stop:611 length:231 start_codon:yes stop_codon:yes gene_type:complete